MTRPSDRVSFKCDMTEYEDTNTSLLAKITSHDLDGAEYLLSKILSQKGLNSLLLETSKGERPKLFSALIKAGADVSYKEPELAKSGNNSCKTWLHYICDKHGNVEMLKEALQSVKDPKVQTAMIDVMDENYCTPMSYAAKCGYGDVLKLLIEEGVSLH